MRVFISWSGEVSQKVATALREWLPSVLQVVEPFVSSADIDKGARWLAEIGRGLDQTGFGILCVTPANAAAPWLNFEAGALARSFDTARVTPFLVGMAPAELTGPISQFQATVATEEDLLALLRSMNKAAGAPLTDERLGQALHLWWPQLDEAISAALKSSEVSASKPERPLRDLVEEVLTITRSLQRSSASQRTRRQPGPELANDLLKAVRAGKDGRMAAVVSTDSSGVQLQTEKPLDRATSDLVNRIGVRHGVVVTEVPLDMDEFERTVAAHEARLAEEDGGFSNSEDAF